MTTDGDFREFNSISIVSKQRLSGVVSNIGGFDETETISREVPIFHGFHRDFWLLRQTSLWNPVFL